MNGYLIWGSPESYSSLSSWLRAGCARFKKKSGGEEPNHLISRDGVALAGMKTTVNPIVPKRTVYIGVEDGRLNQNSRLGP